ncbi:MAG: type II toxin-antitoxin system VapC family toxin [Kiritimatiellia bacterium]|nr:type II toxin-antitoxin system VapC family toxin [Kiritimatiellia bacterium]MDP6848272.1 type II toxin-antitoxin system VapC family toxin [Kiritimatiellia bacterium]
MRVLLDTQIALWALTDSPRLSQEARSLILEPANDIYFSAASIWEIAIKHRLARHDMPVSGDEAANLCRSAGYIELPVTSIHAATTEALPLHHSDPFDRILVAQAKSEPMHLVTHDRMLPQYGDSILLV